MPLNSYTANFKILCKKKEKFLMTQQQTDTKMMQLLCAAVLTEAMAPTIAGKAHDEAEALIQTQHARWYNMLSRIMMPDGATMPDGSLARPAGTYADPPAVDPVAAINNLAANPAALQTLASKLAPLLALIPGVGPAAAATAQAIGALPPIPIAAPK